MRSLWGFMRVAQRVASGEERGPEEVGEQSVRSFSAVLLHRCCSLKPYHLQQPHPLFHIRLLSFRLLAAGWSWADARDMDTLYKDWLDPGKRFVRVVRVRVVTRGTWHMARAADSLLQLSRNGWGSCACAGHYRHSKRLAGHVRRLSAKLFPAPPPCCPLGLRTHALSVLPTPFAPTHVRAPARAMQLLARDTALSVTQEHVKRVC